MLRIEVLLNTISIKDILDDLLIEKRRRTQFDLARNEQLDQQALNEVIKDRQGL